MKTLLKLVDHLERNTDALKRIDHSQKHIKGNPYYKLLRQAEECRVMDLKQVHALKKRVLRMRYRILENINGEVLKEMNTTSVMKRNLLRQN